MIIYAIKSDPDRFEYVDSDCRTAADGGDIIDLYDSGDGRRMLPIAAAWSEPELPMYSRRVKKTDYLSAYGLFPAFSEAAVGALSAYFNRSDVELLPMRVGGRRFSMYRSLTRLDCTVPDEGVLLLDEARFLEERIRGGIFQCRAQGWTALCREDFKNDFEREGLVGAVFRPVWPQAERDRWYSEANRQRGRA